MRKFESSVTRLKIRQKLALLTAIPLIAVLIFAALAVVTTGRQALDAEQLRTMVVGNAAAGELVYELQAERESAVRFLTGDDKKGLADDYYDKVADTKKATDAYNKVRSKLTDAPSGTAAILDRVDTQLRRLDGIRKRVGVRDQATSAAAFSYRIIIAELLSFRESVPQAVSSGSGDRIRAANLLARNIEYLGIENVAVLRTLDSGEMSDAAQQEIVAANTGGIEASLSFDSLADSKWSQWLEKAQSGAQMIDAQTIEDEALRTPPGNELDVDSKSWTESMAWRLDQLKQVQVQIDQQIINDVTDSRDEQYRSTAAQILGVLLAVIVALFLAMRLGGPVVRGLRRLRDTAHQVATTDLPQAVAQLNDHDVLGEQTPEEFAKEATPPVRIQGRDELADVGRAFNEVHQEAIRVAAHQALLRLHIGAMFIRLARRGHSLSGRLTAVVDEAERNEQDPDRLDRLFRLDHLVTLLSRTNDSLLVLGGASPAVARASDESASSVLTAAQGQIEQYQRVQITAVDEGFSIKASVVDDVVKLLAELLDNATRYSDQPVNVTSRLLADRMVIQIYDRGIGIDPERLEKLNARLSVRTPLDLDAFQAMGLTVVGHLATQHGIQVELRRVATGGTLAEVSLPAGLLAEQSSPLALPAGSQQGDQQAGSDTQQRRGAPLFSRGRKRGRKSTNNDTAAPARQPSRAISDGGRNQLVSPGNLPVTGAPDNSDADTPILRLEWRTAGQDATAPVATQPELEAQRHAERPRTFGFASHSEAAAGWRAAERANEVSSETPENGLPRREPQARLVPGSVETPQETRSRRVLPTYRDPDAVGATYAAYVKARAGNRPRPRPQSTNQSRKTT